MNIYKTNIATWIGGIFYKANTELKLPINTARYFLAKKVISLKTTTKKGKSNGTSQT